MSNTALPSFRFPAGLGSLLPGKVVSPRMARWPSGSPGGLALWGLLGLLVLSVMNERPVWSDVRGSGG